MKHTPLPDRFKAGVAVVFDSTGKPKMKPGWVKRLNPEQRAAVEATLERRGLGPNATTNEDKGNGNSG